MEYEEGDKVGPRRSLLLMVQARDNSDGTKAVATEVSKNIRLQGQKQGAHKAAPDCHKPC